MLWLFLYIQNTHFPPSAQRFMLSVKLAFGLFCSLTRCDMLLFSLFRISLMFKFNTLKKSMIVAIWASVMSSVLPGIRVGRWCMTICSICYAFMVCLSSKKRGYSSLKSCTGCFWNFSLTLKKTVKDLLKIKISALSISKFGWTGTSGLPVSCGKK